MFRHPADVEQIEHRRPFNPDMDALYILSAESHIVDCLMADFEVERYRKAFLVWTSCQSAPVEASQLRHSQLMYSQSSIHSSESGLTDLKWRATASQTTES